MKMAQEHPIRQPGTAASCEGLSSSNLYRLRSGAAYGMTDAGLVRCRNEDNFLIDRDLCLVMVGDGLGGHAAGDIASAEALCCVRGFLDEAMRRDAACAGAPRRSASDQRLLAARDPDITCANAAMPAIGTMYDAIDFANKTLHAHNRERLLTEHSGMGTTLTGLWRPGADDDTLIVFHVGDSRLYRYRRGHMDLITRDQTAYQRALDAGFAGKPSDAHMLLQAIGPAPGVAPEIHAHRAQPEDVYLLCSDGLHNCVSREQLQSQLAQADAPHQLEPVCQRLIALAKAAGGKDNITAVLVRFSS